jgi:hypothetical protein
MAFVVAGLALGAVAASFVLRRTPFQQLDWAVVPHRPPGYAPKHRRPTRLGW